MYTHVHNCAGPLNQGPWASGAQLAWEALAGVRYRAPFAHARRPILLIIHTYSQHLRGPRADISQPPAPPLVSRGTF